MHRNHHFIYIHHVCVRIQHIVVGIMISILWFTIYHIYPFWIIFAFNFNLFKFVCCVCKTNEPKIIFGILKMVNVRLPYLLSQNSNVRILFPRKPILYKSQTSAFGLFNSEVVVFKQCYNVYVFILVKQIFKI